MTSTLAVFDLDGTLTRTDTLIPFLLTTRPGASLRTIPGSLVSVLRARGRGDRGPRRDRAKEALIDDVFRDRSFDEVERWGERFAQRLAPRLFRPDVVARLRSHQDRGDLVAIASASPTFTVHPIARRLDVDRIICTEIRPDGAGRWRYVDGNVRGAHKLDRVRDLAEVCAATKVVAYGDSGDDLPMLRWADDGLRVVGRPFGRVELRAVESADV